jgi:probable 2-oxoglutarate dehydrogenase E1 component DHKTD1
MLRDFRKPLIVVGPKLLLRHPSAVSSFADMIPGTRFLPVLDDLDIAHPQNVKKVCFVSGKLYYELVKELDGTADRGQYAFVR